MATKALRFLALYELFLGAWNPCGAVTIPVPSKYPTIQEGIDAAAFGDTVLVAPGTYTDYETRKIGGGFPETSCMFLKDGVHVMSEGGPGVTAIDLISIAGPQTAAITAEELPSDETSVRGFTIEGRDRGALGASIALNGNVTIQDCKFQNFQGGITSGGAVIAVGNCSILDCEFENCKATGGGAIFAGEGHLQLLRSRFQNCRNIAVNLDQPQGSVTTLELADCEFIDNYSLSAGAGAVVFRGSGTVRGCVFVRNVCYGTGAGALGMGSGMKVVEDCVFIENGALAPNGQGGAISSGAFPFTIRNCTFVGNYKNLNAGEGSAINVDFASTLENNIIAESYGGVVIEDFNAPVTSRCNVFWNNPQGIGMPLSSTDRIVDPQFCDSDGGDYTLRMGSPCLPEDPLGCGLIGAYEQDCGPVSVENLSWGDIKGLYR